MAATRMATSGGRDRNAQATLSKHPCVANVYSVINEPNTKSRARKSSTEAAADAFIEQMGLIMAADGLPRIGGRIVALLLITDGDISLDDIATRLRVSKPSVSINARLLEEKGVIEKVSHAADRRDYYRITDDVIGRTMQQRLNRLHRLQACVAGARTSLVGAPPAVAERLDNFAAACTQLSELTAKTLEQWRAVPGRTTEGR